MSTGNTPTLFGDIETALSAEEALLIRTLRDIAEPQPKQTLICVTYKMPVSRYRAMKESVTYWHLAYSDILRFTAHYLTPALMNPSGELLRLLEEHRQSEIRKAMERRFKRNPSLRHFLPASETE